MSEPGDFELIRDTLLRMDPETRHQVIEAMTEIRKLPPLAAARVLAEAGARARERVDLETRPMWRAG